MIELPSWIPGELTTAEHVDVTEAAAALLRVCRAQRQLLEQTAPQRIALKAPGPKAQSKLSIEARRLARVLAGGGAPPLRLSSVELAQVATLADALCAPLVVDAAAGPVLRCRVAAEILDAGWGFRFVLSLRSRSGTPTVEGDPIPRIRADLRGLFEGELTTASARQDELPTDELAHLGLARSTGASFDLDLARGVLPDPHRELRLAWLDPLTAVQAPTRSPPQAPAATDALVHITEPAGDGPGRFRLFPVDAARNCHETLALLGQADEAGAEIAVAPELTIGHDGIGAIRAWLAAATHLRMIVCGSAHVADAPGGTFVNRATVLVRRAGAGAAQVRTFAHEKFNPFDFPIDGLSYYEHIVCGTPRLTSLVISDWERGHEASPLTWSYGVVICKDLMSDAFADLFGDSRVGMLIAPVMTPKTDTFAGIVSGLAAEHQTTSVLANHDPLAGSPALLAERPTVKNRAASRPRPPVAGPLIIQPFKIAW